MERKKRSGNGSRPPQGQGKSSTSQNKANIVRLLFIIKGKRNAQRLPEVIVAGMTPGIPPPPPRPAVAVPFRRRLERGNGGTGNGLRWNAGSLREAERWIDGQRERETESERQTFLYLFEINHSV